MSCPKLILAAALIVASASSFAQPPPTAGASSPALPLAPVPVSLWQRQAAEAERARDFDRAIDLYRAAAAEAPNPVPLLVQIGRLQRLAGNADAAQATYEDVLRRVPAAPRAMLGMAMVEVMRGNSDAAAGWLERAVAAGIPPNLLEGQADLAPLRSLPGYRAQLERATQFANPCRYQPEFSAFDFWIGDWDIYVNGQYAGRNLITREMNGCIVHERAELTSGYRGESLNYYDPLERRWKQNFVSNGANVIAYSGSSPRPGVMEMNGTSVVPGSATVQLQRVVWEQQADGTVTHTVSVSNDDGKSWSPGFTGRYFRTGRATPTRDPDGTYPYNDALNRPPGSAR